MLSGITRLLTDGRPDFMDFKLCSIGLHIYFDVMSAWRNLIPYMDNFCGMQEVHLNNGKLWYTPRHVFVFLFLMRIKEDVQSLVNLILKQKETYPWYLNVFWLDFHISFLCEMYSADVQLFIQMFSCSLIRVK